MIEFVSPDFVQENNPEDIQERMMNSLPTDIDTMPGGFPYDFTMPTALEKSELIQFHLVRTLMLMFPAWAWDEWLDYHARAAGVSRKEAGYANGFVTINGTEGTQISKGAVFATAATDSSPSIEFATVKEEIIKTDGTVEMEVIAVNSGKESNVPEGTVTLMSKPIKGIASLRNNAAIIGGTEREDDDSLRERIQESYESWDTSFVGNDSDYIRWAKEIVGIGSCIIIPEWNGAGTVKLVLLDANGQPANSHLIDEVYNHIMSPDDRLARKAPIGAIISVVAPSIIKVTYSATLILKQDYDIDYVKEEFTKKVAKYYEISKSDGVLRYSKVASIISEIVGVIDYSNLLINSGTENIILQQDEYPETKESIFEVVT